MNNIEYTSYFEKKATTRDFIGIPLKEENYNKLLVFIKDITSLKKSENELVKSEKKYRLIYETSSDAIMTLEPPSWKFTSGNPAIVKMFGVKNENEFTSLKPWQVSPKYQPDGQLSSDKAKQMIEKAMKDGSNYFEWVHKKVGGNNFFATVLLNRVDIGEKTFIQARVQDISKKKKAENALRESEEKLSTISKNSPDCFKLLDLKGNIIYHNKASLENHGIKEMMGKHIAEITSAVIAKRAKKDFNKAKNGESVSVEYEIPTKQGNVKYVYRSYVPVKNDKNKISRVYVQCRNITEIRKAEKKLSELDKLKSRFITALTHVTRTPLSSIRWGMETLLSGDFGKLSKDQEIFVRQSLTAEKTILNLISNMNFVIDIERGAVLYEKTSTSLLSVVKSLLKEHESYFEAEKIKLSIKYSENKLPPINIDPGKVRIALHVLLDNAIQYSNEGGSISLEVNIKNNNIIFKISDKGIGIPEEEQQNIFERFFRASNAQTKNPNGVGIGLYIAKSIINAHEGKIKFISKEGKGSSFTVSLPKDTITS